ncbi:MAG TPA: hypothetical protein VGH27_35660 [Streptosporangiaceae bacterium]|jgi:CubicO group peptidase (beta-lactamase class C family)
MTQGDPITVSGTCAPRFELVRQEFERNFAERGEAGASVAVTLDGEPFVDLWGGFADPRARMSFGYAMNRHGAGAGLNERGQSLIDAAYRSLGYATDAFGSWA